MVIDRSKWAGRRVFITGHTGFKGSWLALWLQSLGADVLGYSLAPPTTSNMFESAAVGSGMRTAFGDIRDLGKLSDAMAAFRPEAVFHLAAQSLVRQSYADPVGTYSTNVMGTVHLLEAVRSAGSVRAVVVVTSDKCYENNEWEWGYRETDPLGGYDPYSNSKGCTELVTSAYRRSFLSASAAEQRDIAVGSARAGNVVGGGDWAADRLVPDFIRAMSEGELFQIRNPAAQRPWQHVLDPLNGYLMLAEALLGASGARFATGWNFGPRDDDALTVGALVQKLVRLWGEGATCSSETSPQPHEATYLKLDCSRARSSLGWRPCLDIDSALRWSVEWYKASRAGASMREMTLMQIDRFSTEAV